MGNKKELVGSIKKLKNKKNAIVLAHNFQSEEVQDAADFVGDSIELALKAVHSKARIVVLAGVRFMAETIKVLAPDKKILLADKNSGCPLAETITQDQLRAWKKENPSAVVVCYISSSAAVKAISDYCVTSANVLEVIDRIDKKKSILFVPDKYLAATVQEKSGRKISPWSGYCPVHVAISPKNIIAMKKEHLEADVLVHPQCTPDVIGLSDKVLSTGQIIQYVKGSANKKFIIGTETGILTRLQKENPHKSFFAASKTASCKDMKLVTLDKIFHALRLEAFQIELRPDIVRGARACLQRMGL